MDNKEREKLKHELVWSSWTEDLHEGLKQIDEEDAKWIVDSMEDDEIHFRVNARKSQEAYIADYIEYLWDISEESYWKQLEATFNLEAGVLWSDNMSHFEKMCNGAIPDSLLTAILNFMRDCKREKQSGDRFSMDLEAIYCVIKAQVEHYDRQKYIEKYISSLPEEDKGIVKSSIKEAINAECDYRFY